MAVESQFIQVANGSTESASTWIYLADWILILILGIAFIFYFGRLAGYIITVGLRMVLWRQSHVMVSVESVRLSILGGRFLIKNLVITTENESYSILRVNLTWRYWLWGATRLSEFNIEGQGRSSATEETEETVRSQISENEKLPSRFLLTMEGLEIFMYNRTYAYDNIMDILSKDTDGKEGIKIEKSAGTDRRTDATSSTSSPSDTTTPSKSNDSSITQADVDPDKPYNTLRMMLRIFPISILIKKAVIVCGNQTTPTLLVSSCKTATGIMDVKRACSQLDVYKQLLFFELENFQVSMKPNIIYKSNSEDLDSARPRPQTVSRFKKVQKKLNVIPGIYGKLTRKKPAVEVNYQNWVGLRRYLGDSLDDLHHLFDNLPNYEDEYAKYSLILDSKLTKVSYYYDIPGIVRHVDESDQESPDYGMDIDLSMATIHYGAWADKQRVPIQSTFFPALARDSEPSEAPPPGQTRQYTGFKMNIVTNDEIIFRIPTRESSKDKEVLKNNNTSNAQNQPQKQIRPFGWLELKVGPNSSVSMFSSFVCSEQEGWPNTLRAVFAKPELSSSVNHDIMYLADVHTLDAKIGYPLKWNGPCEWTFDNYSTNSRIFFLREHTLLLSDIFTDFGSGPPVPYEEFRMFKYIFNWNLIHYKFYLNVNDSNIINNPLDFTTNKYISIQGEEFKVNVEVPLLGQFSQLTTVDYHLYAPCFNLILDLPPWHTSHAFSEPSTLLGRAENFTIDGSYTYFSSVEVQSCDHIVIRSKSDNVMLKLYGAWAKYVFIIRENYLGDNFHFKTFDEYNQGLSDENDSHHVTDDFNDMPINYDYWKMVKTENNIDVLFSFQAKKGLMILPHDIYGCKKHIGLSINSFDTDIRFTNYYMDMQTDLSPMYGKMVILPEGQDEDAALLDIDDYLATYSIREDSDIYFDDLTIHGHRMFGIPPHEITYYCNWRIATEEISICGTPEFLRFFGNSLSSFGYSFVDLQNTLHHVVPTVYDAVFFTFQCPLVSIKAICDEKELKLELNSLTMSYNDLANKRYSSKLAVNIPDISITISDTKTQQMYGFFKTSLNMANITRKPKYHEHRRLQQRHIRFNDAPFHRCPFLLFEETKDSNYNDAYTSMIVPMTLPDVPYPLNKQTKRIYETKNNSKVSLSSYSSESSLGVSLSESEEGQKNLFISPTTHYHDEDFAPESQNDPKYNYDTFLLTFSDVLGFMSPDAVGFFAAFQTDKLETDLSDLMDSLEKDIISDLKDLMHQVCMDDTVRAVAPAIDLTFGVLEGVSEQEILNAMKTRPSTNILISEPSVAFSSRTTRRLVEGSQYDVYKDQTVALSVKSVVVNVCNPTVFDLPINFAVKDIEVWLTDSDNNSVVSVTNDEIAFNLDESQAVWLLCYIDELSKQLQPSFESFKQIDLISNRTRAALVYTLSTASKEFKIDHDPAVLTRPAYLIRTLKEHIRFMDTWVVLIRLRHIFENMDKEWVKSKQEALKKSDFEVPKTAYDETWDIFSNWRSWEANFAERESFFQTLFDVKSLIEKKLIARSLFNKASITLSNENSMTSDYLTFQDIHVTVSNHKTETMFSKVDNALETDFDASVQSFEFLLNLGGYKGSVSPIMLNIIPSLMDEIERVGPKSEDGLSSDASLKNNSVFLIVNVNNFEQKVSLDCISVDFSAANFNMNGISQVIESEKYLSLTTKASSLKVDVTADEETVFHQRFDGLNVVFGNGKQPKNMVFVDLFVEHGVTEAHTKKLSKTLDSVLDKDLKYLQMFTKSNSPQNAECDGSVLDLLSSLDLTLSVQVNHYTWVIDVLSPIVFDGAVYDNSFSVLLSDGVMDVSSLLQKVDLNAKGSKDSTILKVEHSQVFNNLKVTSYQNKPVIYVDSQIGFSKVLAPRLVKSLNELLDSSQGVKEEVDGVMRALERVSELDEKEQESEEQEQEEQEEQEESEKKHKDKNKNKGLDFLNAPIDIKISNDYMSVTFVADRSRYSTEVEDFDLKVSNILFGDQLQIVPFFGSLVIPSTRISVVDRIIPIGLSNVIDFNVLIKILSEPENSKGQILEVSSQYCRVCLSAFVIQRLVALADEITILGKRGQKELNKMRKELRSREGNGENGGGGATGGVNDDAAAVDSGDSFNLFSNISGVHFLSYRFCLGWIFGNGSKSYPGLILGAERFYAVTDENMGKLSLLEAYLAVAHGTTSSTFFGAHSERSSINRAFLPFMQFTYMISEVNGSKDMKVAIKGDQLDVDYLSSAILILEYGIQSVSTVQEFFDKRVRPMDKWKDDSKTSEEQHIDYINSLRSTFTSIEFTTMFAGSNVLIHKLGASDSADDEGSLFLQFPAVKSITTYAHDKVGVKKHVMKSEILTSSSDNKLHASCVPVLVDLIEGTKRMMKSTGVDNEMSRSVSQTGTGTGIATGTGTRARSATKASDISSTSSKSDSKHFASSILAETEFYVGIKIEGQKLSLSCEPTAKVEAVVGMGGICLVLNSGVDSSIDFMGTLSSITASLQHIYSREVSGSISMDRVILSTNVDFTNEVEIKSALSLCDIAGYVNVKQYQDLALFSDIWFPDTKPRGRNEPEATKPMKPVSSSVNEKLSSNKNITMRFREVSTTNAIPWLATVVLSNISLKVNCGPSLGEMMLKLDQFWVVSKKTPDWTQVLKVGINSFEITSHGRLGGTFLGEDIYLHSEIDWKTEDGGVLDVPLILMSFGIDKLCVKSTFDYHVFTVVNAHDLSIDIYNQKNELSISKDHLFVNAQFKNFEVFMSSFTASNVLDIYNTVLRMTQDNRISYKETLHDSRNNHQKVDSVTSKLFDNAILETVKKLETEFEVVAGRFMVQVYPSSFEDSKVLIVKLDESRANFSQNEFNKGISNQLDILFNDLTVSLSVNDPVPENFIQETTVEGFSKYANKARGGNMFVFPSFRISMKTFQEYHSNIVEYVYESTFGGTVDVRWNLGSVNFIREMYTIHLKSLESRTEFRRSLKSGKPETSVVFNEQIFDYKTDKPHENTLIDPKTDKIDEVINEKIDQVSKHSKYVYLPLALPIIQAPQLKELGNATPPLEWFGLHRNKFPNVTHELGIVNLQKIIHQVEMEYSRLLGRA